MRAWVFLTTVTAESLFLASLFPSALPYPDAPLRGVRLRCIFPGILPVSSVPQLPLDLQSILALENVPGSALLSLRIMEILADSGGVGWQPTLLPCCSLHFLSVFVLHP